MKRAAPRLSASFVGVAVVLAALAVLYRTVGDRTTWSEGLTIWPPFVWCAVLCGDFNTPGGARSLAPLRTIVEDVWPRAGMGWGGTMTADLPVSRIDQCWATPDIEPLAAQVVRSGGSDHRALVVDFEVQTKAR